MKIRLPRHPGASLNAAPAGELPPVGATEGEAPIPVISIDGTQFRSLLAEVATNAWKGQLRLANWPGDELLSERRRIERNFESILSGLESFGVRVKDHTGEAYDFGQALKVVAAQPQDGIEREVVTETIRPTVYWREHIIQRGEVVIATPHEEG
jgi:hypothetical protein